MCDIILRDIKQLKFLTGEEINFLYKKRPNHFLYLVLGYQESLRNLLLEYLNTPFLISNKISLELTKFKKKYLELEIDLKELNSIPKIKDLPTIIVHGYCQLDSLLKQINTSGQIENIEITKLKKNYYSQYPVIEEYVEFTNKEFSKYLSSSIIHGSCSDLETTSFSDLDTFLIIRKEIVASKKLLKEFKKCWIKSLKYLYQFDSLQHHNHFIATGYDLNFFPYHWLPPQIFSNSKSIYGNSTLKINVYRSDFFNFKAFLSLAQRFRDPNIVNKIYNEFSLKNDISVLALFPALYLQTLGHDVTKKESFCDEIFLSTDNNLFYKKITKIRSQWKVGKINYFVLSKFYNYYLHKIYLKYFISPVGKHEITKNSKIKESFLLELNNLINKMSFNIIRDPK